MSEDINLSFIQLYKDYHRMHTDAPLRFGEFLGIQLLGHALGYEPANLIQPKEVRHNMYVLLVGKSTISRKSTSQQPARDVYPVERRAPEETTPEQLVALLAAQPERLQFLGEFSRLLKAMNQRGHYMSTFIELYNDLHGCPKHYKRELRKETFEINNCYLSVNSTVTPEMLRQCLTEELVEGGFLARWLLVYGDPNPRPRQRLGGQAFELRDTISKILNAVVNMTDKKLYFVLDDEALKTYNEIEQLAYRKYERVLPFVGRYLNYVISIADILIVSDAIGKAVEEGIDVGRFSKLVDLVSLVGLVHLVKSNDLDPGATNLTKVTKPLNLLNLLNLPADEVVIMPKEYVVRAWNLIEPCLRFATSLVDYAELEPYVAKVKAMFERNPGPIEHSRALQNSNLMVDKFSKAVKTLNERGELKVIEVWC